MPFSVHFGPVNDRPTPRCPPPAPSRLFYHHSWLTALSCANNLLLQKEFEQCKAQDA